MKRFLLAAVEKYKVLHFIYWFYSIYTESHERVHFLGGTFYDHFPKVILLKFLQACAVYTTIFILIPKYVQRKKYALFALSAFAVCMAVGIISSFAMVAISSGKSSSPSSILFMLMSTTIDALVVTTIFSAITILYRYFINDALVKKAEREKLQSELMLLKTQINPHFLFNAINSIYVLINLDPSMASEALLKFSGMLRYQLYECAGDFVPLAKEISFINDYIKIESLRKEDIDVSFDVSINGTSARIPPFILLPFVENAFKHISKSNGVKSFIDVKISKVEKGIEFNVRNSYLNSVQSKNGGIGLQNVRRRLDLLYKDRHELFINEDNNLYNVRLKLYD